MAANKKVTGEKAVLQKQKRKALADLKVIKAKRAEEEEAWQELAAEVAEARSLGGFWPAHALIENLQTRKRTRQVQP
jgi:hypothetical protein